MMNTKQMLKDLKRIAPDVEALTDAYRAGYKRRTMDYCKQTIIGTAAGLVVTGILTAFMYRNITTKEEEESES